MGIEPLYFLDQMTDPEVKSLIEANNDREKSEWERARLIAYWSVVAMNGNKNMKKPSDLFKFPWEQKKKTEKKHGKTLTKEEFEALANKANNIQDGKKGIRGRG